MEVAIKDLGEIITGNTPSKKNNCFYGSSDICFVKPNLINDKGVTEINEANEYISEEARDKARIVKKGAIFVTCIGSIGKIGIAGEGEFAFNQQINAVVPNERVIPKYLAYNILYNKFRLVAMANAPVVPIINKSQFGEFIIKIDENKAKQNEILKVIDKTNGIIVHKKQELIMIDTLIKSRFVEMFGEPILNQYGFKKKKIKDVITEVRYGTSKPAIEGGGYKYLRMNNITNDGCLDLTDLKYINISREEIEKCIVRKGDVLFNRTNSIDLVGKTCVFDMDEEMVIAGYIIRVRLKESILPIYLSTFMNLEYSKKLLRSMAKGAVNQANINAQELQSIEIIVPPIELQNEFAAFVQQIDKLKLQKNLRNKITHNKHQYKRYNNLVQE